MNIVPGTRLGRYDVLSGLGAGGMGEVYLARDTKLGREVALKVLHARFSDNAEHLARFRREASILATLNHSHIAAIHELDETDGVLLLVMEFVPGETLHERLLAGALTVSETLRICSQIAAALEAAHAKSIVHRDLKPSNIKVTPDGVVKVLDFGLSKALAGGDANPDPAHSPTVTAGTLAGVILGTAAYMSPEQARGKLVDHRSDIWSFGCVMFEALTNRRPFGGETVSDSIAGILEREPDWGLLPPATPDAVRRLLRRCLQKELHRRLRDIGDARLEIDDALATPSATAIPGGASGGAMRWEWVAGGAVILTIGAVLGALATLALKGSAPVSLRPPGHFTVSLPPTERLASLDFPAVAISPDASRLVYVATRGGRAQLFLREMNRLGATPIPGTANAIGPFFSPDGGWIGFFADGKLKKVRVSGGAPATVCDAPIGFGGSWGSGDIIVFAATSGSGLSRVAAAGGTPMQATALDAQHGEFSHRWPEVLPDGNTVLFSVGTVGSWDDAQIVAQSLTSGQRQILIQGGSNPRYLATGHLLYARGGAMMAVPFDAGQLKVTGPPIRVLDNVFESADGAAQLSVSRSGSVVLVPGNFASTSQRVMAVDRSGTLTPYAAPPRAYAHPRLAPDGRTLAVTVVGATEDLWTYDITRGVLNQVTFDANTSSPTWTPDGQHVTFSSMKTGTPNLFWIRVDGSGAEERLASSDNLQLSGSWSPDGKTLAFVELSPTTGRDILMLPHAANRKAYAFIGSTHDESAPRFSPDGRWMAYVSNASGRNEVYVCPVSDPSRTRQISNGGGSEPVWARDGRELYYRSGDRMMGASVSGGAEFRVSDPQVLFEGSFEKGTLDVANYDVTPDGQHFIMIKASDVKAQDELHVLLDWFGPALSARPPPP